jgi:hypothetical protein
MINHDDTRHCGSRRFGRAAASVGINPVGCVLGVRAAGKEATTMLRLLLTNTSLTFWAAPHHQMDVLMNNWGSVRSDRNAFNIKVVVDPKFPRDDPPEKPPAKPVQPIPTDVPMPEPHDIPARAPIDVPPPDPGKVPPDTKPRPVP